MTAAVRAAFQDQARACRDLGSALTARICDTLADKLDPAQGPVAARVLSWPGAVGPSGASVPLRLCGAPHGLVLEGVDPALARAYSAGEAGAPLLLAALDRHAARVMAWLDHAPQTNEVARAAVLIAAARHLAKQAPLPLVALELGASAGLNLNFAHYTLDPGATADTPGRVVLTPDWRGVLPRAAIHVEAAQGVDLNPLDPQRDGIRLLAYCWPDQTARLLRLRAALALAQIHPPRVQRGDAITFLEQALSRPRPGRLTLIYHTIAWQYFPADLQQRGEAMLDRAGARATPDAPLARLSMEADGGVGAALSLQLWDGSARRWSLGRADFHGRWVSWNPQMSQA